MNVESHRKRLSAERAGLIHKFSIAGQEGFIRTGHYDDGTLGEVFISVSKAGATMHGIVDAFATLVSMSLQHGVPLEAMAAKFIDARFEPSGFTQNPDIPEASSIIDYAFRWLVSKYGGSHVGGNPQA